MNCSIEKQREVFAEISAAEVGFIMGKKLQKCNFFSTQLLNSITNFRSIEKKTLKLGPQNLKFVLKRPEICIIWRTKGKQNQHEQHPKICQEGNTCFSKTSYPVNETSRRNVALFHACHEY